jgi:hypothetical protein
MARPPGVIDWLVIGAFVILAAVIIYLLQPLVVGIATMQWTTCSKVVHRAEGSSGLASLSIF